MAPKIMDTKIETTQIISTELKLSHKDIIELLVQSRTISGNGNIIVSFNVPGGGDWSNTNIAIDEKHPIIVQIKEIIHHD